MELRIKPHPAVALILQHLRFEARGFDVVASVGERKRLDRERERNTRIIGSRLTCN